MPQKTQRNLDELDHATREAAERAASQAGMPLAEWLGNLVAEHAGGNAGEQIGLRGGAQRAGKVAAGAASSGPSIASQIDAIAARLEGLSDPLKSLGPRDVRTRRASDALLHETSLKTVTALETVTRWMEEADSRWAAAARASDERQERSMLAFTRAFDALGRRLDTLESRVESGATDNAAVQPVWAALKRMEGEVARLAARGGDVERLERTLNGFESRLGTIAERLAATAPRARIRRADLPDAIAEIRHRQAELEDDVAATGRPTAPASAAALAETQRLGAEVSRLVDALKDMVPRSAIETLKTSVEAIGARLDDGSLAQAPAATTAAIEGLHAEIRNVAGALERNADSVTGEIRSILSALREIDTADTDRLAEEIAELRRLATAGPDRRQIDQLAGQVADLTRRLDDVASRQVDPAEIATLRAAMEALHASLKQPGRGAGSLDLAPVLTFVEGIGAQVEGLGRKLDAVAEKVGTAPARPADAKLNSLLASLIDRLDRMAESKSDTTADGIAIAAIDRKLDRLADALSGPRPQVDALEKALADITRKLDNVQTARGGDQPSEALERAIDALATRIDRVSPTQALTEEETRRIVGEALSSAQTLSSERIDQTLATIGGTLDKLLGRLAMLEREQSAQPLVVAKTPMAAEPVAEDDHPLEPGSGRPVLPPRRPAEKAADPAPRVEAEAILDQPLKAQPEPSPVVPDPAGAAARAAMASAADRASMIAAARRAAQAAAEEAARGSGKGGGTASRSTFTERLRGVAARRTPEVQPEAPQEPVFTAPAPAVALEPAIVADTPPAEAGMSGLSGALARMRTALQTKRKPILYALAVVVLAIATAQVVRNELAPPAPAALKPPAGEAAPVRPAPAEPEVTNSVAPAPQPDRRSELQKALDQAKAALARSDAAGLSSSATAPAKTPAQTSAAAPSASAPSAGLPAEFTAPVPLAPAAQATFDQRPVVAAAPGVIVPPPAAAQHTEAAPAAAMPDVVTARSSTPPRIADLKPADLPPNITPGGLRKAALAGDAVALFEVASRMAEGRGITQNLPAAVRLFERLGAEGYAPAQFRVANMYEKGTAGRRDLVLAKAWYERAAERGNVRAMHNLAVIYAEGGTGGPDYPAAVRWFERAAEYGVSDSQYNLAILKARGLGTERDLKGSLRWFSVAAAQGDADAARKRDEVAARLSPAELEAALDGAQKFKPLTPDRLANEVVLPENGYEETAASKGQKRARS